MDLSGLVTRPILRTAHLSTLTPSTSPKMTLSLSMCPTSRLLGQCGRAGCGQQHVCPGGAAEVQGEAVAGGGASTSALHCRHPPEAGGDDCQLREK